MFKNGTTRFASRVLCMRSSPVLGSPGWVLAPSFDFARKQPRKHGNLAIPLPGLSQKRRLHSHPPIFQDRLPYAAAKAGVIVLTSQVANEVGSHDVRVNCLAPHTVLVERTRRFMPEEHQRRTAAEIPLRRLGTPEDVALATLFLASESSSWITGVTLDVAGGKVTD